MSKKPAKRHIKKLAAARKPASGQAGAGARAARPGVMTVDPSIEKAVQKVFFGYVIRMMLTLFLTILTAIVVVHFVKVDKSLAPGMVFMSVMLGLVLSYRRGVAQVFLEIRKLGSERLAQHRYADAVFALEHFHRMGNMGFDKDGRAHYELMLAYQGMGQQARASDMATWLTKYRGRSTYAAKLVKGHQSEIAPAADQDLSRPQDPANIEESEAPKQ